MRRITEKEGSVLLKGQRCCVLECKKGQLNLIIKMKKGKLRINHCCYTPDGGTWLSFPDGGRTAHYNLIEGSEYTLAFEIKESFGKNDRIEFVNPSFFKKCEFEYAYAEVLNKG